MQAVKKANCTLRVLVVLPPSHLAHINPVTVTVTLDNAKVRVRASKYNSVERPQVGCQTVAASK